MFKITRQARVRNNLLSERVYYLKTIGCRARRRWLRPFEVKVF
jgi:hypothetical protein